MTGMESATIGQAFCKRTDFYDLLGNQVAVPTNKILITCETQLGCSFRTVYVDCVPSRSPPLLMEGAE